MIIARADEGEALAREPTQQRDRLFNFFRRRLRAGAAELFGAIEHALAHRFVIGDAGAHIGKRRAHAFMQSARLGLRERRHMHLDQRVAAAAMRRRRDRVKHRERRDALIGQLAQNGIDQERHVRPGYLQNIALDGAPAGANAGTHAHGLFFRRAFPAPQPEIVRERGEIVEAEIAEFIQRRVFVKPAEKQLRRGAYAILGAERRPRSARRACHKFVCGNGEVPARCGIHGCSLLADGAKLTGPAQSATGGGRWRTLGVSVKLELMP